MIIFTILHIFGEHMFAYHNRGIQFHGTNFRGETNLHIVLEIKVSQTQVKGRSKFFNEHYGPLPGVNKFKP